MTTTVQTTNLETIKQMWAKVEELTSRPVKPRLLVGGKTGVGKSSLLNALLGKAAYETGVIPTTRDNDEQEWRSGAGDIVVVDTPGFAEADPGQDADHAGNIRRLVDAQAHLFILVLKCDDRALEVESTWLVEARAQQFFEKVPTVVAVNQIDKMKPVRDWDPSRLNLGTPTTEKEKNIRTYLDYVGGLPAFAPFDAQKRILPVSAGESPEDPSYGIDHLKELLYTLLPDAAKTEFARAAELQRLEAQRIIKYYAGLAAGAVLANFVPASDALLIAPIQVALIVHLGRLHGIPMSASTASGLVSSLGLSFAGRFAAQSLVSLFPGFKHIVGPGLAFGLTISMGTAVNRLFSAGRATATAAELQELAAQAGKEGQEASHDYEDRP